MPRSCCDAAARPALKGARGDRVGSCYLLVAQLQDHILTIRAIFVDLVIENRVFSSEDEVSIRVDRILKRAGLELVTGHLILDQSRRFHDLISRNLSGL
jgi:hypothetical protein